MISIEVTSDELQILVQALDTHVRQHGIQVAAIVAALLLKLQTAAQALSS